MAASNMANKSNANRDRYKHKIDSKPNWTYNLKMKLANLKNVVNQDHKIWAHFIVLINEEVNKQVFEGVRSNVTRAEHRNWEPIWRNI